VATSKFRPWRALFLLAFSILLFSSITVILAAPRIVPRLTSILKHLKYRPPQHPLAGLTSPSPTATYSTYVPILTHASDLKMSKYSNPPQAPPLFTGTKESIVADAKALCDKTRVALDKLVADASASGKSASFDTVLQPQIEDENGSSLVSRILGFYQYVSGEASLRDASTEAEKLLDDFSIEVSMREDVFKLVDSVYKTSGIKEATDKAPDGNIDDAGAVALGLHNAESARLLDKEHKAYIKNGLALPSEAQRERFKEIKKRLSQIQISFQKNLNEENGGIWFTKEELDGVPEDVIDGLEKGTGENEGKVKLSFKYPDLFPTLKFANNPETRRKVFIQNENKVSFLMLAAMGMKSFN
jgi:metallopeptidase MepB